MGNRQFVSGNEAVAIGVRLSKPKVIGAYPITPQTIVVERLSEMVEDGSLDAQYMHVESEHSALSAMMGASATGVRTFTASSSQGLLYMTECLHYASGGRFPIVMMNANRSVALPWSIYGDQRDSLSLLDSGWIQVYVEDAQESLDMIIQAYAIAENEKVLTPLMVNLDGFSITHTYEQIDVPNEVEVDNFLPKYQSSYAFDFFNPKNMGFSSTPLDNMEFKYLQNKGMFNAIDVINKVDKDFGDKFGRYYGGLTEEYKTAGADYVIVTLGSITGTVRSTVDKMREKGERVGLLKIRFMRPFPENDLIKLSENAKAIGVLEKDISFGYEGTVFTNVASAIGKSKNNPSLLNFIGGLGGRDISREDIESIFLDLKESSEGIKKPKVKFINMGVEIDE